MNSNAAATPELDAKSGRKPHRRIPPEANIFFILIGIALIYEILGWIFIGQSFLMNQQRLTIMILQVSVIGIIAVGVTQVIITGGIDLSSGSVVGCRSSSRLLSAFSPACWPVSSMGSSLPARKSRPSLPLSA